MTISSEDEFVPSKRSATEAVFDKINNPTPSHYNFTYKGIKIDPYVILETYGIVHPAQQHAIKKLLRAGKSHKDLKQDIEEVIAALNRWLEMIHVDDPNQTELDLNVKNNVINLAPEARENHLTERKCKCGQRVKVIRAWTTWNCPVCDVIN